MNHEEIVVKLLQLVLDNNRNGERNRNEEERSEGDEKIADIMEKLKEGGDMEVLRKILDALKKTGPCRENLELKVISNSGTSEESNFEKWKE
ncbi:hypothetical protein JTB14_000511 [Gonioctena quinquepunctata]|nr:hypothetical protein JTB14_000511 [Gonioctena quinquepunctata]